jgi:hypothetical protein
MSFYFEIHRIISEKYVMIQVKIVEISHQRRGEER